MQAGHSTHAEDRLRDELEDTFPASDPPAVTRRQTRDAPSMAGTDDKAHESEGPRIRGGPEVDLGQVVLGAPTAKVAFIAGLAGCVLLAFWLTARQ